MFSVGYLMFRAIIAGTTGPAGRLFLEEANLLKADMCRYAS
jgi:hypothetical protein